MLIQILISVIFLVPIQKNGNAWFEVVDILEGKIFKILEQDGVTIPEKGVIEVLKPFMERNGFRDGRGWWINT